MQLLEALNWRYAAKHFTGQPVPAAKLDVILEAIRLAASSTGLQPYRVVVVADHALRARIHQVACPQPQVVEGSHLLVFAARTDLTPADLETYLDRIVQVRQVPRQSLQGFADSVLGTLLSMSPAQAHDWCARQAYLALGFGLVAAAVEQVDACPMEGFEATALDELLGLEAQQLRSVVVLALGYRDAQKDFLAHARKVRKSRQELFSER